MFKWRALEPHFIDYLLTLATERVKVIRYDLSKVAVKTLADEYLVEWHKKYASYLEARKLWDAKEGKVNQHDYPYMPSALVSAYRDYDLFRVLSNVRGEMPDNIGNIMHRIEDLTILSDPIQQELISNGDLHSWGYATVDELRSWDGWKKRLSEYPLYIPYQHFIKNGKWAKKVQACTELVNPATAKKKHPSEFCSPLLFELINLERDPASAPYKPKDFHLCIDDPELSDMYAYTYVDAWGRKDLVPCYVNPKVECVVSQWFMRFLGHLYTVCKTNKIKYSELRLVCCYDN